MQAGAFHRMKLRRSSDVFFFKPPAQAVRMPPACVPFLPLVPQVDGPLPLVHDALADGGELFAGRSRVR